MKRSGRWLLPSIACFFCALSAQAHDLPLSYVDLQIDGAAVDVTVEASAKNFARELNTVSEESLLDASTGNGAREQIQAIIDRHLSIIADGNRISLGPVTVEPLRARRDLKLRFHASASAPIAAVHVSCDLFSFDPRHRTFLNIYRGGKLHFQGVFDSKTGQVDSALGVSQPLVAVVRRFLWEGVHHIFIGPDHILFIIGLLLLGGSVGQLLKIVTAFTVAHTVTLVLATLNIVNPPPRLIEPAIALSIVFVGSHALLRPASKRDWRLLFAFCFGFVHGFGFASVLRAMELPRAALGWSLFSFNAGVEIGQACIVLAVAPLLALLYQRTPRAAGQIVTAGSFCVVAAGSFWFVQRLFPAG